MGLREANIERLGAEPLDVLVVGGGINGAVCASALAAHGAKVGLIDARDFAGLTSQHSSNLVWGGIKYLEGHEFSLVTELCASRNELMRAYPSTIKEIRFLTTVAPGFRHGPATLCLGAWLYWLLGRGFTRTPDLLNTDQLRAREPIINAEGCAGGIEYSDAFLHDNDARFVFNFVRDALDRGARIANYVRCERLERGADGWWSVQATDQVRAASITIRARVLVNAAGPFADPLNALAGIESRYQHVLSKGVHLIVPRLSSNDRVLAFFADDGRLFFAIPMASCTCIGTTDTRVQSPLAEVTAADRAFILENINSRLNLSRPLVEADILSERCGVRPLAVASGASEAADFLQLSRRHVVETTAPRKHISIFGGKLTDCLNVGREVCASVAGLGVRLASPDGAWFGEPGPSVRNEFDRRARALGLMRSAAADTGEDLATRLWRRYGHRANSILDRLEDTPDSLDPVYAGTGLRWCEIDYLRDHEMVVTLEDVLRRRSKLSLLLGKGHLRESAQTRRLCEVLFGTQALAQLEAYFQD